MNPNQSNGKSPQSSSYFNFAFSGPSVLTGRNECLKIRLDDSIIHGLRSGSANFLLQFDSGRSSATATIGDKTYGVRFEKAAPPAFLYYQLAQHKFTKAQLPAHPSSARGIDMYSTDMAYIGEAACTLSLGPEQQKQLCIPIPISKPPAPKTLSSPASPTYILNSSNSNNSSGGLHQQQFQTQEQAAPSQLLPRIKLPPLTRRSQSPAVKKDDRERTSQGAQRSQSQSQSQSQSRSQSQSQSPLAHSLTIPLQARPLHPPPAQTSGATGGARQQQQQQHNKSLSLSPPGPAALSGKSVERDDDEKNDENENDDEVMTAAENVVKQERQSQQQFQPQPQPQGQKGRGKEAVTVSPTNVGAGGVAKKREREREKEREKVGGAEEYDELEEELSLEELRRKLGVKRIGSVREFEVLKRFYNKYQRELRASFGELKRLMPRIREERAKASRLPPQQAAAAGGGAVIVSSQQQQQAEEIEENVRKWRKMVEDYNTLHSILHDSRHLFKEFVVRYRRSERAENSSSNSNNNNNNNSSSSSSSSGTQPQNKRQRMRK